MESRTHSAWMALGMALFGILQALALQYVTKAWWPFWVDDLVVATLLGVAGWLVLRDSTSTHSRLLSAAWGGMVLALWGSTFRHINSLPFEHDAPHLTVMTVGMFALLALAALGLMLSLPTTKRPFIGTRPPKEEKQNARR